MRNLKFHWSLIFVLLSSFAGISISQDASNKNRDEPAARTAVEKLAEALVAAPDDEARLSLLRNEKDVAASELVKALLAIGERSINRGNYAAGLTASRLAREMAQKSNERRGLADALLVEGNIHERRGNYAPAMDAYQKSLQLRESLDDKVGIARLLNSIGNIHRGKGDPAQALESYQKGLRIGESLAAKVEMAQSLVGIGNVHERQGKYPEALEAYRRSLQVSEESKNQAGVAKALGSIGNVHHYQSDFVRAMEYYQKSLRMHEFLGDRQNAALVLNNIGIVHRNQGRYSQALEAYRKSLQIREALGDKNGIAMALNSIGVLHRNQGEFAQANDCYQQSLRIFEELGDKNGQATALGNIGIAQEALGNYSRALDYYQRSLKLFESLGNRLGIGAILVNIGGLYEAQGNYAQALETYGKSLEIRESLGDKVGIATAHENIGNIHRNQGDYAQALEAYQKSLEIGESVKDEAGIASTLGNIGNVHFIQGDYAGAEPRYRKSLQAYESLDDKAGIASMLIGLGLIHERKGDYDQTLKFAERATTLARQIDSPETIQAALVAAGRAYQMLQRPEQARRAYAEAVEIVESLRFNVAGGGEEQQRFFENKVLPYLAMTDLLVSRNVLSEALGFAERAKARVLLDTLQAGRVNLTKAMSAQEREQEAQLRAQLVSLNSQIFRERQGENPERNRLKDWETERAKLQLAMEDFQTSLYSAHPDLKIKRGESQPISLEEAAALLPDEKTALLEFVVAEEKATLFVLTKAAKAGQVTPDLKAFTIPVKARDLAARARSFRQLLAGNDIGFKKEAESLNDLLLGPARNLLQGKTSLVIVPDGALWELPFAGLVRGNRFLVEDAAIAFAPSLTYLREMGRKQRPRAGAPPMALLAMGDPALSEQTVAQSRRRTRGESKLEPLPDARKEAAALGALYGAKQSRVYLGAEALEERFKAEAANYRILHLATHGVLSGNSPMYSHIVLSQSGGSGKEDGLLEAREILDLDLKADLAVLSACETARGRVGAGEGVIGLSWALFVAGVPATVVSHWKVQDASTRQLMVEFHRQMKSNPARGKAEALRQAALNVMKTARLPYFWAGFMLVGDGR